MIDLTVFDLQALQVAEKERRETLNPSNLSLLSVRRQQGGKGLADSASEDGVILVAERR